MDKQNNQEAKITTINEVWSKMIDCILHDAVSLLVPVRFGLNHLLTSLPKMLQGYQIALEHGLIEVDDKTKSRLFKEGNVHSMQNEITNTFDRMDKIHSLKQATLEQNEQAFQISAFLQDFIAQYNFSTPEQRSLVHVELKKEFTIGLSKCWLETLLANLMSNALRSIEHAQKGEIFIWTEINDQYGELHFKDTGLGIDSDLLSRVFDRFFSKRADGIAPGLGLCRLAILIAGGELICEAEKDEFAHFTLRLPLV